MASFTEETNAESMESLDRELEQLARFHTSAKDYLPRFLELIVSRLDADHGEAWGVSQQGVFTMIGRTGNPAAPQADTSNHRQHLQRLQQVLASGQAAVQRPDINQGAASPRVPLALLAPIRHANDCVGVVAVAYSSNDEMSDDTFSARLELLDQLMKRHVSKFLDGLQSDAPTRAEFEFLRRLEAFTRRLHKQKSSMEVARTTANEARLLLGCDRVVFALRRGNRAEVAAISGQERVVQRSNLVRAIAKLATESLQSNHVVHYAGSLEGVAPQMEKHLVEYLSESAASGLICAPLAAPLDNVNDGEAGNDEQLESNQRHLADPIGVLFVEQLIDDGKVFSQQRVDMIAAHVSQALQTTLEQERIFLRPIRKAIGTALQWATSDGRKTCLLLGVMLALVFASLAFVPAPYRVKAEGRLMPVIQRRVFAAQDGQVMEVYVTDGQRIQAGQPLMRLRNDKLAIRILTVRNELHQKQQLSAALEAQEGDVRRNASATEQIRLRGRIAQSNIETKSLQLELKELESQQSQLLVKSEIDGVVATFRPQALLVGRPVHHGQKLLEIVDPNGPWQLELEIPANGLGRVIEAQRIRKQKQLDHRLPMQFVLATASQHTYRGRMSEMATRVNLGDDGTAAIKVIAAVEQIEQPTIGAEVIARVDCGATNLAYAIFGDLIETVRRHVW